MPLSDIPGSEYEQTMGELRERVFRAFLTAGALPGERRLSYPKDWSLGEVVRDANDAYGYTPSKRKFNPSPKDVSDFLPVMGAIAYYRKNNDHGERNYKILLARAFDVPFWRLADQFSVSERTLWRWQERAVEEIMRKVLTEMSATEHVSKTNGAPRLAG